MSNHSLLPLCFLVQLSLRKLDYYNNLSLFQPLLLSGLVIHSTPEVDSTELRLEHNRSILSLTMASANEKSLWLRRITQAQAEVTHSDKCKLQIQQSSESSVVASYMLGRIGQNQ